MKTAIKYYSRGGWFLLALCASVFPASAQQVDIRSYGAKCNGGDDAAAVQAAINAAPNGGTVLVSCQAAIGSAGLKLEGRSNLTILGSGSGAGFKSLAPTGNTIVGISWSSLLRIRNCTKCAVRNLEFQMNYQPAAAMGLNYNTETIIDGNKIYNVGNGKPDAQNHAGPSAAIEAALNTSNKYTNNLVQHTIGWYGGSANGQSDGPRGMWIGNNGNPEKSPLIANNTIIDTFHTGIAINTDNGTITGNRVYNSGTTGKNQKCGGACIKETNVASVQTTIANNDLEFCGQGVQLETAGNITIQNNVIHGVVDSGIYGFANNVKVIGNTFRDNPNGVSDLGGDNWTYTDNTFSDDPAVSTLVSNSLRMLAIYSDKPIGRRTLSNNNIGTNRDGGIHIYDQGGKVNGPVSMTNNRITNGGHAGIMIEQNSGGAINNISQSGNCFAANAGGAIKDTRGMISSPSQSSSCANAPSVTLTSPVGGTPYVEPATILLQSSASGNGTSIAKVEYFAGTTKIGEATASPYSYTYSNVAAGNYVLTAKATSSTGPSATSNSVTIAVSGSTPEPPPPPPPPPPPANKVPTVSLTGPIQGTKFTAPANIAVTANASDSDGSIAMVEFFAGSTKIGQSASSPYSVTWSNVVPGTYMISAKATDNAGASVSSAAASITVNAAPPPPPTAAVPTTGLGLWLKADTGITLNGSLVSKWADQSGNGVNAVQTSSGSQPKFVQSVVNGKPALQFDGVSDQMSFPMPVNGLTGMTVFLISSNTTSKDGGAYGCNNSVLSWIETADWGTMYFGPFQNVVKYQFATGQANNLPKYNRPASIGAAYTMTTALKNGTAEALYVGGQLVLSQTGKLAAIAKTQNTGNLALGYSGTHFPGSIAEVLVYKRALTNTERQQVEQYLKTKYGL